jgi:Na+/H+ antiporter NhaD/arsenite permease-like protein
MTPAAGADDPSIVHLSGRRYLAACAAVAAAIVWIGRPLPAWTIAAETLLAVVGLFVLGSIRYRLDKNALAYGAALVIGATFWTSWWPDAPLRAAMADEGWAPLWDFARRHLFSLRGLDKIIHAHTLLFIFGLTFFVACVGKTRLLEAAALAVLRRTGGDVRTTVIVLAAVVSFASGILDGVSMIGLMIRTLLILLLLAKADRADLVYAVMISTVVTTVCGMWLAYGEPPNLIMKANLHPHLDDAYFLRYCLPLAAGAYLIVVWNLRRRLGPARVSADDLAAAEREAEALPPTGADRRRAQRIAVFSFVPFVGLLVWHAADHAVPLYLSSFAGFAVAFFAVAPHVEIRREALREARHECAEYLFLIPLFFSITLLQRSGFFVQITGLLASGIETLGAAQMAFAQFAGATLLSALLDNNVVADFAGRALAALPLDAALLHLFATAQIAGYAAGGCWTQIGSAQSVVAFAFIRRNLDAGFTPFRWIREMTPLVLEISAWMTLAIYVRAWIF